MITQLLSAAALAALLVFVIHCNIEYWFVMTPEDRRRALDDADTWW